MISLLDAATLSEAARPGLSAFGASHASVSMDASKVTLLNRVTFNKTVSQKHVDHWIVLYCVDWWEMCQGIWEEYKTLAGYWEHALIANASSWQATAVRFAEVDCTTDKALCNDNNVEEYPTLQHFHKGKFMKGWELSDGATSLSKDIAKWVREEFARNYSASTQAKRHRAGHDENAIYNSVKSGLSDFRDLLSWTDPIQAVFGYVVLVSIIAVLIWSLEAGFELDMIQKILGIAQTAKHKARPSALLPDLPKLPEPRTIVRNSIII
jgi:hypothetical protein